MPHRNPKRRGLAYKVTIVFSLTLLRLNTNQGWSTTLNVFHYTTSNATISVALLKILSGTSNLST
jgi:hypothetical protein